LFWPWYEISIGEHLEESSSLVNLLPCLVQEPRVFNIIFAGLGTMDGTRTSQLGRRRRKGPCHACGHHVANSVGRSNKTGLLSRRCAATKSINQWTALLAFLLLVCSALLAPVDGTHTGTQPSNRAPLAVDKQRETIAVCLLSSSRVCIEFFVTLPPWRTIF
jgi:hypothetical protein